MPNPYRSDPGPCPTCGAAHSACTSSDPGPIAIPQTPARDGVEARAVTVPVVRPLAAEVRQETLPPGQVTTATYRGKGKQKP